MIVLDTHTWIWWSRDKKMLSAPAVAAISRSSATAVAAISIWEVAFLARRRRIDLHLPSAEWFDVAFSGGEFEALPITPAIAIRAASLEVLRDPADRLIVATALEHHAPLVTKDDRIRNANVIDTIW